MGPTTTTRRAAPDYRPTSEQPAPDANAAQPYGNAAYAEQIGSADYEQPGGWLAWASPTESNETASGSTAPDWAEDHASVGAMGSSTERNPGVLPATAPDPALARFASQIFRLQNHAPSTGLGKFDVEYVPAKGEVVARLNLEVFFEISRDTPSWERPWPWQEENGWTDAEEQQYEERLQVQTIRKLPPRPGARRRDLERRLAFHATGMFRLRQLGTAPLLTRSPRRPRRCYALV